MPLNCMLFACEWFNKRKQYVESTAGWHMVDVAVLLDVSVWAMLNIIIVDLTARPT
jgi:hypothetical protein